MAPPDWPTRGVPQGDRMRDWQQLASVSPPHDPPFYEDALSFGSRRPRPCSTLRPTGTGLREGRENGSTATSWCGAASCGVLRCQGSQF
jgi:hypothetical protein